MKTTREPSFISGIRSPLFDRLLEISDEAATSPSCHGVLDRNALRNSIAKELEQLLNTRSHTIAPTVRSLGASVFDYGLPPFSHFSSASVSDLAQFSEILAKTIQQFEPRLESVHVKLTSHAKHPRSAVGSIDAFLRLESISEPVSFPLFVDPVTGQTHLE